MATNDCKVLFNDIAHLTREVEDHELRLRSLEKAHWRMAAAVSVAASIFSALGAVAAKLIAG